MNKWTESLIESVAFNEARGVFTDDILDEFLDEVRGLTYIAVNSEKPKEVEFNLTYDMDEWSEKEFIGYLKSGIEELTDRKVKKIVMLDDETAQVKLK